MMKSWPGEQQVDNMWAASVPPAWPGLAWSVERQQSEATHLRPETRDLIDRLVKIANTEQLQ